MMRVNSFDIQRLSILKLKLVLPLHVYAIDKGLNNMLTCKHINVIRERPIF